MKFRASIFSLLVSVNVVFFVSCNEFPETGNVTVLEKTDNVENRWQFEKKNFQKGLKIKNEKGELIEVTAEDAPPRESGRRGLENNIYFHLYTIKNPQKSQQLTMNDYSSVNELKWSHYDSQRPTYFITHGWLNTGGSASCTYIRDAYLRNNVINVIIVDWSSISISSYGWAVTHVPFVGKKIAQMIKFLMVNGGLDPDKTILIGHSLGAHIVGIAGYETNGTINTVIGLDPALPMFSLAPCGKRISRLDAKNVQIIHTNAGYLGYEEPIGTVDFYPNGGTSQQSCIFDVGGSCSHGRAYEFFAESINSLTGFYGRPCQSKMHFIVGTCQGPNVARMGGLEPKQQLCGTYYLWTHNGAPYAAGIEA